MRFNVISNLSNGVGLQRDYEMLRMELERRGHQVRGVQFNAPRNLLPAEVNVFLEVVNLDLMRLAPQNWMIPNPEWWGQQWNTVPFTRVLTKTLDGLRIFQQKFGVRCSYLGWKARDFYVETVPREVRCLHVAGRSRYKNTEAVIEACQMVGLPLTIVSDWVHGARRRISDEEMGRLLNSHLFHVMPSAYEGFGQALHESFGVGAVVITTNAPPMNELRPSILVDPVSCVPSAAAVLHKVTAEGVARGLRRALELSPDALQRVRTLARQRFVEDTRQFEANLTVVLEQSHANATV